MVVLSLGLTRGVVAGLLGTGLGMGIAMLARLALGLPAWNPGPVTAVGTLTGVLAYFVGLGAFNDWFRWAIGAQDVEEFEHHRAPHDAAPHWTRYFSFDHNHKVIAVQYIMASLFFMLFAGLLALVVRLELSSPGNTITDPGTFNSAMSAHGIIMLLGVVLPAISALMNYLVPLMIGARDMAFPRLNAFSFWLVPPAGLLMAFSLVAGGFDTGWTGYPPLSANAPLGMQLVFLGAYLGGLSSILTAVNILVTILKLRAPGMSFFRMPIFVWASLATAILQLGFTQFIAMSFLMVVLERLLGMGFFRPEMGGNVLLFQHLFWFYSHPAVYIFVLPGLGVISEVLPVFVRKPLFGYEAVALSSIGIAVGGAIVWGHHMFAAGIEEWLRVPFMISTMLVAVPTGVKIFSWLATMWLGKMRLATPMLFVLTAIVVFLIGGITGVPLAVVPTDLPVHDTYFIVAHFHYTLFGGFVFPLMAALYYWFPKVTGRFLDEGLGKFHWGFMSVGFLVMTLPMFWLGLNGMRRRVADYAPDQGFASMNLLATIGAFLVALGVAFLAVNLVRSLLRGARAPANPWHSWTLEWQVSSPPPEENFERIPEVVGYPYPYGLRGAVHAVIPLAGASDDSPATPHKEVL